MESTVMKKQQRKKRLENLFSRYFGQSSRPYSGDLRKAGLNVRNIGKTFSSRVFLCCFFITVDSIYLKQQDLDCGLFLIENSTCTIQTYLVCFACCPTFSDRLEENNMYLQQVDTW